MNSLFDLTGHVAVVSGGNSGIGLAMARGLAGSGADVCIWGTNTARNDDAVTALAEFGTRVHGIRCDVSDEASVVDAFAEAVEHFGRVDSCFANAGRHSTTTAFVDTDLAAFRSVTAVNLDGAFLTLREAAKHMVSRAGGGVLVGTSSVSALHGTPRGQAYAASKAGLSAMIRSCAIELARHGINAHSLIVGWTQTPLISEELSDPAFERNVMKRMPQRRWGTPADFERLAVYLAGGIGGFHTGDEIVVDGGYSVF